MAQASPAKVKVTGINQVALVVKDARRVAENYWNILGIGPWEIYEWDPTEVHDRKYHGKPAWAREVMALTQVGTVWMELMQPVDGYSFHQDFLIEHGEGIEHLNFLVDDVDGVDKTAEILAEQGFPSLQSGRPGDNGAHNFIDIKPLRAIWEVVHLPKTRGIKPTYYPETAQTSPAKVKVTRINQVALVVKDLQMVAENYWNILGIGPWEIYAWESPEVYERKYHGKPAWAREKIALAQVGAVQLELVQPVDGDSVYQDFLIEHGEGLHHINFVVDDVDKTAEILVEEGFPSLQSGRCGYDGAFNYIDIKPLRAIWEVVHPPTKRTMKPTHCPED